MAQTISPEVIEDRCRQALKDLPYVDDVWVDTDDFNMGEPALHIHITLDEEYMDGASSD